MIQCTCGKPDCKAGLSFDTGGIYLHDKEGRESLMYVDPNAIVDIIRELRKMLTNLTQEDE